MPVEDEILFFISATMPSYSSVVASLTVTWTQAIYVGFLGHGVGDGIDDSSGVGFDLGLRPAPDGDHVAAVSTITSLGNSYS